MKFKKLQQGGFVPFTPVPSRGIPIPEQAPTGASGKEDDSLGFGDIFKEIAKGDKGLHNDVNEFLIKIRELENTSNVPYLSNQNRSAQLAIFGEWTSVVMNKKMWDEAKNTAKSNKGLNEIAVGSSGEVFTKNNDGSINTLTINEYKKIRNKTPLLSVADLLNERNSNPTLVNNNSIFKIAENSVGLETISAYAQSIINSLGTETESSEYVANKRDALSSKKLIEDQVSSGNIPSESTLKGFEILKHISESPSDYSKIKQKDSTQRNHVVRAVNYIWSTLDSNSQNKLRVQAELSNQSPTNLLMDLAVISGNTSSAFSVNPMSESEATGKPSSEAQGTSMTPLQTFLKATHRVPGQTYVFNDPEIGQKFNATITGSLPFVSPEGKELGTTTLYGMLQSKWNYLVDQNNIYFGKTKVNTHQQRDILFDGTSDISRVLLPVDNDGVSPDLSSLETYNDLMEKYNNNKDTMTKRQITDMFEAKGFLVNFDENGNLDVSSKQDRIKPFLIMTGFTTSAAEKLIKDNDDPEKWGLRKLDSDETKALKKIEDLGWVINRPGKPLDVKPSAKLLGGRKRYKGAVIMPLLDNASLIGDEILKVGAKQESYSREQVMSQNQNSSNQPFINTDINLFE